MLNYNVITLSLSDDLIIGKFNIDKDNLRLLLIVIAMTGFIGVSYLNNSGNNPLISEPNRPNQQLSTEQVQFSGQTNEFESGESSSSTGDDQVNTNRDPEPVSSSRSITEYEQPEKPTDQNSLIKKHNIHELRDIELVDYTSLSSCTVKASDQNQTNQFTPGTTNTISLRIPGWNWLNEFESKGLGDSPFITPPVSKARSNSNIPGTNYANQFSLPGKLRLTSGEELTIPILGNGIASLFNSSNYTSQTYSSEILSPDDRSQSVTKPDVAQLFASTNPFSLNQFSTSFERDRAETAFPELDNNGRNVVYICEDSATGDQRSGLSFSEAQALSQENSTNFSCREDTTITATREAVLSDVVYDNFNTPVCSGNEEITSVYDSRRRVASASGEDILIDPPDNYTSPEFILSDEELDRIASGEIRELEIPLLLEALATAYLDERYSSNDFYIPGQEYRQVVHRNRVGARVEINLRSYSNNLESIQFNDNETGESPEINGVSFPEIAEGESDERQSQILSEKSYEVYLPWVGQIREIYKRLAFADNWTNEFQETEVSRNQAIRDAIQTNFSDLEFILTPELLGNGAPGDAAIINTIQILENNATSPLYLFTCNELDGYVDRLDSSILDQIESLSDSQRSDRRIINIRQATEEAITEINRTDCLDTTGQMEDPLQSYLCSKNKLPESICSFNDADEVVSPTRQRICYVEDEIDLSLPKIDSGTGESVSQQSVANRNDDNENNDYTTPVIGSFVRGVFDKHPGIDIAVPTGTPVKTIASGRCIYAGPVNSDSVNAFRLWQTPAGGYGNVVLIEHTTESGENMYSLYAHLDSIAPQLEGCQEQVPEWYQNLSREIPDNVNANSAIIIPDNFTIGNSGDEGNSTGPHLHFELRKNLQPPYRYQENGIDPNFYNPQCIFSEGINCNFAESIRQEANVSQIGNEICVERTQPNIVTDYQNPENIDIGEYVFDDIGGNYNSYGDVPTCGNIPAGFNRQGDLSLLNLSDRMGYREGTNDSYRTIFNIIYEIARFEKVPPEKLASQLHVEAFGVNSPDASLSNKFNGNVDQTHNPNPNQCGCIGPGQFCVGTSFNYFHPEGAHYDRVLRCSQNLGFYNDIDPESSRKPLINPALVGPGLCGTAVMLSNRSGLNASLANLPPDVDKVREIWEGGCRPTELNQPEVGYRGNSTFADETEEETFSRVLGVSGNCSYVKSSKAYLGNCSSSRTNRLYCYHSANFYGDSSGRYDIYPESVIHKYKVRYTGGSDDQ